MPIIDSDILIGILRGEEDAAKTVRKLESENQRIGTTVINAYELLLGALLHSKPEEKLPQAESLLNSLILYSLNPPSSWVAARISSKLLKRGEMIDFQDISIASIALTNNETLITRNLKHFRRIEGLKIKEW